MANLYGTEKEIQLIAFILGGEEYTVPITCVQEIIMPQKTTHIPRSPQFVEGVINLRGKIIPIIDARKRFGITSCSENKVADNRIIVLEINDHTIGLIVDSVSEVIHLNTADIEPTPIETSDDSKFIYGIGKLKGRLLILLDPENLFDGHEIQSISGFTKLAKSIAETISETELQKV